MNINLMYHLYKKIDIDNYDAKLNSTITIKSKIPVILSLIFMKWYRSMCISY